MNTVTQPSLIPIVCTSMYQHSAHSDPLPPVEELVCRIMECTISINVLYVYLAVPRAIGPSVYITNQLHFFSAHHEMLQVEEGTERPLLPQSHSCRWGLR